MSEKELIELFKEINRSDASYLNEPEIRKKIFVRNFDTLVSLTRKQGFPGLSKTASNRKILESGIRGTFLHVLQTNPMYLLNPDIIALFKTELLAGRLDKQLLKFALRAFQTDHDHQSGIHWTSEITENFTLALCEWDIQLD
ncbi:hypothetical protein D3C86_1152960 [compost metagenome]